MTGAVFRHRDRTMQHAVTCKPLVKYWIISLVQVQHLMNYDSLNLELTLKNHDGLLYCPLISLRTVMKLFHISKAGAIKIYQNAGVTLSEMFLRNGQRKRRKSCHDLPIKPFREAIRKPKAIWSHHTILFSQTWSSHLAESHQKETLPHRLVQQYSDSKHEGDSTGKSVSLSHLYGASWLKNHQY